MLSIFLPRGIRNNNPGNIRLSKTQWLGQKPAPQSDLDFVEFSDPVYGLRALMKLLLTYHVKYGLDTVEHIINRYAPPHENDTDGYAYAVKRSMRVRGMDKIDLTSKPVLISLAAAIVRHENGKPALGKPDAWYAPELYERAADMVLPPGR